MQNNPLDWEVTAKLFFNNELLKVVSFGPFENPIDVLADIIEEYEDSLFRASEEARLSLLRSGDPFESCGQPDGSLAIAAIIPPTRR